jgi:MFS family permease
MIKKLLSGILGGFLGLIVGAIGGGFLGLVVGGTFLGGFDIYEHTGLEGYELALYIGAIIGAVVMIIVRIKIALGKVKRRSS